MLTREELQGSWTQLKGQVRERWGQITDDELQQVHGDAEQLLGFLQRKTGQSRQDVERFIRQAMDKGSQTANKAAEGAQSAMQHASETAREYAGQAREYAGQATQAVRDYASQAGESVRQGYEQVEQQLADGYEDAQQLVRSRPMESISAAFAAGLVAGVVVSLILKGSSRA